jgi:hypothetical protein
MRPSVLGEIQQRDFVAVDPAHPFLLVAHAMRTAYMGVSLGTFNRESTFFPRRGKWC